MGKHVSLGTFYNNPLDLVEAGSEKGIGGRGGAAAAEEGRRFGDDCAGRKIVVSMRYTHSEAP